VLERYLMSYLLVGGVIVGVGPETGDLAEGVLVREGGMLLLVGSEVVGHVDVVGGGGTLLALSLGLLGGSGSRVLVSTVIVVDEAHDEVLLATLDRQAPRSEVLLDVLKEDSLVVVGRSRVVLVILILVILVILALILVIVLVILVLIAVPVLIVELILDLVEEHVAISIHHGVGEDTAEGLTLLDSRAILHLAGLESVFGDRGHGSVLPSVGGADLTKGRTVASTDGTEFALGGRLLALVCDGTGSPLAVTIIGGESETDGDAGGRHDDRGVVCVCVYVGCMIERKVGGFQF